MNNKIIIDLFEELDELANTASNIDEYGRLYWHIKMRIVEEVSRRYGVTYNPETLRVLKIPCAIMSMIVEMERERLRL